MKPKKMSLHIFGLVILLTSQIKFSEAALSMKQFEQSLQMMRRACLPKSGASEVAANGLKTGKFPDDDHDLKCYTLCVAETSGVLSKKKEFVEAKLKTQAQVILPPELQEHATKSWDACKTVQKEYKDPCDKVFYTFKSSHSVDPAKFTFA